MFFHIVYHSGTSLLSSKTIPKNVIETINISEIQVESSQGIEMKERRKWGGREAFRIYVVLVESL
jgi:hypothetical protein